MSLVKARSTREQEPDEGGPVTRMNSPQLFCRAHGCPLRWSVQTNDITACSYHAWEDEKKWPAITEQLQRFGRWELPMGKESPTVHDMKTRRRGRLTPPEPRL